MALEPSSVQRDRMLAQGKSSLTLAQFLAFKDMDAVREYLVETRNFVLAEKGTRGHQLKIEQVITTGIFPYQYLVVDSFPTSQAVLMAHEKTREIRLAALISCYALLIQPHPWLPGIVKSLGFLQSPLTSLLNTAEAKTIPESPGTLNPDTDPDLEKVREFGSRDLDQPFFMMNLNQFYPQGKRSYHLYSAWITPFLVSVGGFPDMYGKVIGSYIGDQNDPLYISWHDFALVYYPSRDSFLRLMTNTPRGAAAIRRGGLKQVVLMAGSKTRS